jgi:UDP-N-acetylmuramoyl-tripeptide--D-alanyl-D-alanine ligase
MVELGDKEKELNTAFGKQISEVADFVFLVGKKRAELIMPGLTDYPQEQIKIVSKVQDAINTALTMNV